jgi:hypothetical protein
MHCSGISYGDGFVVAGASQDSNYVDYYDYEYSHGSATAFFRKDVV